MDRGTNGLSKATIGRALMRRKVVFNLVHAFALMATIVAAFLGEVGHAAWNLLALAMFLLALWALFMSQARVRCPRCDNNLGHLSLVAFTGWLWAKPIVFCPFCRVALDTPVESASRVNDAPG